MQVNLVPKVVQSEGNKGVEPLTRRKATNGEVLILHKSVKGYASTIQDKVARRQYLNMQLDILRSQKYDAQHKRHGKKENE